MLNKKLPMTPKKPPPKLSFKGNIPTSFDVYYSNNQLNTVSRTLDFEKTRKDQNKNYVKNTWESFERNDDPPKIIFKSLWV